MRDTLPRSQLNRLLHNAFQYSIETEADFIAEASKLVQMQLDDLLKNNTDYTIANDHPLNAQDHIIDGPLSGINRQALISLYNLERFWDYADPFHEFKVNQAVAGETA